jgi:hypothetical protein
MGMRGLSDKFMKDFFGGELKGFLLVVQSDDTLNLEIRNNYVNIYYRGGNLCRIVFRNNVYRMEFDKRYAKLKEHQDFIGNMEAWSINTWVGNIPYLKTIMDRSGALYAEKEFQQLIVWENNRSRICNDTDYYIADIEYQMAISDENGKQRQRRLDMVAIKWPSTHSGHRNNKNLRLAFIEVKYGDGALNDIAGIAEHIRDWHHLLENKEKWNELRDDALRVFNQKVKLKLFGKVPNEIESISEDMPELILLIANHKPQKTALDTELRKACDSEVYKALCECGSELKIASASYMGYGLYEACVRPLEKYLGEKQQ